jgi:hypothetical protein
LPALASSHGRQKAARRFPDGARCGGNNLLKAKLMIQEKKKRIRLELLKKLKSHKEEDRFRKSAEIARKLFSLKNYLKAKTVLFYLSLDGEVDTVSMIRDSMKQGKGLRFP